MKLFKIKLTSGLFTPLLIVVVAIVDGNAKALRKIHDNSQETLVTAKMTQVEDGIYKCHHHQNDHTHHHRKRRYVPSPFKFHTMVVLWHVTNFSAKLPKQVQLSVFKEAFNKWHIASRLNFSYTNNATEAHIKISFLTNHFNDGPGGALAHAYSPHPNSGYPGEIHFDEDENWVTTATGGANLRAVALHEIGHAIGIKHSDVADSVMSDIITNNKTQLHQDDISAIRWMYGKCEVRDLTAVLHDRFGDHGDTVLVMKKGKVYRVSAYSGQIVNEDHEKWPKDIRDYYRATDAVYDNVFPLRAAFYVKGDHHVYLFGQNHFIRKTPKENRKMTRGRTYDFKDIMTWKRNSAGRWFRVAEGPLPYSPMNIYHTPDFFKLFLTNNVTFGASFEVGCCYWQHFFMNGTHYKISLHNFNNKVIEDMSVNFPGAPRNPDASWYDMVSNEWYFFKADKYYKWDASVHQFTDRGPITLLWFSVCD